jgi:hypothetical protein
MPVGVAPAFAVSWRALPLWAGEIRFVGPSVGSVSTAVGEASLERELITAGVRLHLAQDDHEIVPWVGAGAGALRVSARGLPHPPFAGSSGSVWSMAGFVAAGVRLRASRSVAIGAETDAIVAAPRPVLRFADGETAAMGRPALLGSLGVEVTW